MEYAIEIKVRKANEQDDLGSSKFFGNPTIPNHYIDLFYDSEMFFAQIKCSDLIPYDPNHYLPHNGYLYIFIDIEQYPYKAKVLYHDGEVDTVIDDFNQEVIGAQHLTNSYIMEFSNTDINSQGNRLLGIATDWPYDENSPKLLLQYDPLASEMPFLDHLDGFVYFIFNGELNEFDKISYHEEIS